MLKPIQELRRMYNLRKPIICCKYSFQEFKQNENDTIDVQVNGEWLRYKPKTHRQKQKVKFYENYNFTISPFIQEEEYRDRVMR